jgi:oligopeptide/dipeptide ABC transporter ATP-binding protein
VSALDVSIRAQIMNLLQDLQEQFGVSYLLIAHDLAAVLHLSSTVAVMYLGKIVELATSEQLRVEPLHPYSKGLFSAALPTHPDEQREEVILTGEIPSPLNPPSGCRFHPRCPFAKPVCSEVEPVLQEVAPGHQVACHLYTEVA